MEDTTNFFLTTPTPLLTAATSAWDPRNDEFLDLFEIKENERMIQQQSENNEPDYDMTSTRTLDSGPESYLTPRKSVRDCVAFLDPPSLTGGNRHCDRKACNRIMSEGHDASHQMAPINIPAIKSKEDNQPRSPLSPKTLSFKLLPRAKSV